MNKLTEIQNELKAKKSRYNAFGKYNYRSCEDILEAVKPLLKKYDASLVISDDMLQVGERYYIRAMASLSLGDGNVFTGVGFARESLDKKGMDDSQITGTASSYARKYALNGLFLIDDSQDSDVTNTDTDSNIEAVLVAVNEAKTKDDLITIWNDNKPLQANKEFLAAIQNRKKDLA